LALNAEILSSNEPQHRHPPTDFDHIPVLVWTKFIAVSIDFLASYYGICLLQPPPAPSGLLQAHGSRLPSKGTDREAAFRYPAIQVFTDLL